MTSEPSSQQPPVAKPKVRLSGALAFLLVLMGTGISLVTLEAGARIWTAMRWPEGSVEARTQSQPVRGRFLISPPTGYKLTPGFRLVSQSGREYTHNSLGFRGPEFAREKANGGVRVVLMGASTIYGLTVGDSDTAAVLAAETLNAARTGRSFEVINAGVPGWTSDDTLLNLEATVLELSPDYVVVMDGRNEMFPQTYNGYVDSYDHFRITDHEELRLQHTHLKRFFRISRAALMVALRKPQWFGIRADFENPVFGRIRLENRPSADEIRRSSADPSRHRAFESNLRQWVAKARAKGTTAVFSTMVYRAPAHKLGRILPSDTDPADLSRVVERNNTIVRSLGRELDVPVIEGASLSQPRWLTDDCHFNESGEREFARMLSAIVLSLEGEPTASRPPPDSGK